MPSTLPRSLKILSIPLISLALTACGGGGGATITITPDRITDYNGNWQSDCFYDNVTDLSSFETIYITDTEYSIYVDEFDNSSCFGTSDFSTEIEGYLYYGDDKPYTSNFCDNAIEVDFVATSIFEDGQQIPTSEISNYLGLTSNVSYDLMCTRNSDLFTGDLSFDDGSSEFSRPFSMNYNRPFRSF